MSDSKIKILITGSTGFIGKNLVERLKDNPLFEILEYNSKDDFNVLKQYCKVCNFVCNFAAVHRPIDPSDFNAVNYKLFDSLLEELRNNNNRCPVLYTSSIQSNNGTLYGESKFKAELSLRSHSIKMKSRGIIYRLTNTFGKYARPYSHSVVATFCVSTIQGKALTVSDPNITMHFAYIDDVIDSFVERITEGFEPIEADSDIYKIPDDKIIDITLGELAKLISSFSHKNTNDITSNVELLFYNTYMSYKSQKKQ